ncbi:hypothetical protein K3495_g3099 [Podosphaera aphanis]|nr:hypothetical protein K3495_g3099 [Podosphaera aphanis]
MDCLPIEIIHQILEESVFMSRCENSTITPLRLVCRLFDAILKPIIFKAICLKIPSFIEYKSHRQSDDCVLRASYYTEALFLDLLLVRDAVEIECLNKLYVLIMDRFPEGAPVLSRLEQCMMNGKTFGEEDFRDLFQVWVFELISNLNHGISCTCFEDTDSLSQRLLQCTPNVHRMKISLPISIFSSNNRTTNKLLSGALECLAKQRAELRMLVIENLDATSVIEIGRNSLDFMNAERVFSSIQELCINIYRLEARQNESRHYFWLLLAKSANLKTLCLRGSDIQRGTRIANSGPGNLYGRWIVRSFPVSGNDNNWKFLRYLELSCMNVVPGELLELFRQIRYSIKEVYLVEVFLKVFATPDFRTSSLWTGCIDVKKSTDVVWVAEDLRNIEGLNLNILRASGLGYDIFFPFPSTSEHDFDIQDPLGLGRSLDQRFVDNFFQNENSDDQLMIREEFGPSEDLVKKTHDRLSLQRSEDYFAEKYQIRRNTANYLEDCVNKVFFNFGERDISEISGISCFCHDLFELLLDVHEELFMAALPLEAIDLEV